MVLAHALSHRLRLHRSRLFRSDRMTPQVVWEKLVARTILGREHHFPYMRLGSWELIRISSGENSCTLARGHRRIGVHCIPVAYNGIDGWVQAFRWFGDPTDEEIAEIVLLL